MRFPIMWYVPPAKPQISVRIRAVWSESLLVVWIFFDCWATDRTAFGVSKLNRRLHRLIWVYTSKNATLLEISCRGSLVFQLFNYNQLLQVCWHGCSQNTVMVTHKGKLLKWALILINYVPLHKMSSLKDHLCCFCLVLLCFHSRLFVDALWLPAGKELTYWLSFVISIVTLSLFHWYSGLVWCLIVSIPDLCPLSYLPLRKEFALWESKFFLKKACNLSPPNVSELWSTDWTYRRHFKVMNLSNDTPVSSPAPWAEMEMSWVGHFNVVTPLDNAYR